jgi:hypothetical protein
MGKPGQRFYLKKEGKNDSNVLRSKLHKQVYYIMGYIPNYSLADPCHHARGLLCGESLHLRLSRVGIYREELRRFCDGLSPFTDSRWIILLFRHEVTKLGGAINSI